MHWKEIPIDDYLLFLRKWRTRKDIMEEFNLGNVSSWHCAKYLAKLNEVQVVKKQGITQRAYMYKTRAFALKEIENKE